MGSSGIERNIFDGLWERVGLRPMLYYAAPSYMYIHFLK
jgi:hypothetical protein